MKKQRIEDDFEDEEDNIPLLMNANALASFEKHISWDKLRAEKLPDDYDDLTEDEKDKIFTSREVRRKKQLLEMYEDFYYHGWDLIQIAKTIKGHLQGLAAWSHKNVKSIKIAVTR